MHIIEDLQDTSRNKKLVFSNLIRTDGYTADIVLMRSNNSKEANLPQQDVNVTDLAKALTPTDLATANICAIDPNRGQVFSASYGFGDRAHQIRQLSTKEYYTLTG